MNQMRGGADEGLYFEEVYYASVQRDARTSLNYKRGLLLCALLASAFGLLTCCLYWVMHVDGAQPGSLGVFWVVFAVIVAAAAALMFVANATMLLSTRTTWMTDVLSGGACVGRDVLDCDRKRYSQNVNDVRETIERQNARFEADLARATRLL